MSTSLAQYGTQHWLYIDFIISLPSFGTKWLNRALLLCDHICPFDTKEWLPISTSTMHYSSPFYALVPAPRSLAFTAITNQLQTHFFCSLKRPPQILSSSVFSSNLQSASQLRCSKEIWTIITICKLNLHPSEVYFEEGLIISLSSFQDFGLPACCWKSLIL